MNGLSPIERACRQHRLADVAQRTGIDLSATVGAVTVRCPMPAHGHPDRTPSMRLYLDEDRYYCFGCTSHGDVVQWVQDAEGTDVMAAVRRLEAGAPVHNSWFGAIGSGTRAGSSAGTQPAVDAPDPARTSSSRIQEAVAAAWEYYTASSRHGRGVDYLHHRGIRVEGLEEFCGRPEVGHTPDSSIGLVTALGQEGFSDTEMIDAGLGRMRSGGSLTDFYRQRVLVPVRANDRSVCGLLGRNVGSDRWPKYVNPPKTAIYDKSAALYQPLPAPTDLDGRIVVVEGPLDAMAIAVGALDSGEHRRLCPVTQSGHELSRRQIATAIELTTGRPVLAFDADSAGQGATARYSREFAEAGFTPVIAALPPGEDPASWLASEGPAGLRIFQQAHLRTLPVVQPASNRCEMAVDLSPIL